MNALDVLRSVIGATGFSLPAADKALADLDAEIKRLREWGEQQVKRGDDEQIGRTKAEAEVVLLRARLEDQAYGLNQALSENERLRDALADLDALVQAADRIVAIRRNHGAVGGAIDGLDAALARVTGKEKA
jgi:hypothetical protein